MKGKSTLTAAPDETHDDEKAPASEHARESHTAVEPEAMQSTKRQAIFLNTQPPPEVEQAVKDCGCAVLVHVNFGGYTRTRCQLADVKRALKLGEVSWLHGVVEPRHWHNPRWTTQCCRIAHRADVPWIVQLTQRPWKVKPFEALRKLK